MIVLKNKNNIQKAFSLIEMMVVIVIIGLIGGIVATRFMGVGERAKVDAAKVGLRNLQGAIKLFKFQVGQYPDRLDDLVEKPRDEKLAKKWTGPLLDGDLPEDPWGNDYIYKRTKGGKHPYELYSEGSDDSPGDISVWDVK